jgi:5-formyltetrahydrofolate cyclo-ligase
VAGPELARREKRRLRTELRSLRQATDRALRAGRSESVLAHARDDRDLLAAPIVAGYAAHDGELDVAPVLAHFASRGARIALPRIAIDGALELVEVTSGGSLAPGRFGIDEPSGPALSPAGLPSGGVVLAPCIAADLTGRRLGRGGGHYDRLLPRLRERGWRTVAVCPIDHVLPRLPSEPHDAHVERVLTEAGWLLAREPRVATTGVVLAGGRSARMGRPKAELEIGGVPMVQRVIAALLAACDDVVVVAAARGRPQADAIEDLLRSDRDLPGHRGRVRILHDDEEHAGPATALARVLPQIDAELAFVSGCDTPLLAPTLVRGLIARAADGSEEIVAPAPAGRLEPLLAVYRVEPMATRLALATRAGPVPLLRVLDDARVRIVSGDDLAALDGGGASFLNVNRPSDLDAAERVLAALARGGSLS